MGSKCVTESVAATEKKQNSYLQGYITRVSRSGWIRNTRFIYLLMVKGWRCGCCLGMQMILGELRLGLPSPELPILLVLPPIPMPWPTWEWLRMFLVFIGKVPLLKHDQIWLDALTFQLISCQLPWWFPGVRYCYESGKWALSCVYLLGDGGVWRDMVGTPVVGVIWLGNWLPCVKFRFNWGVLFPIPLTEKPSAPAKRGKEQIETKTQHCQKTQKDSHVFCPTNSQILIRNPVENKRVKVHNNITLLLLLSKLQRCLCVRLTLWTVQTCPKLRQLTRWWWRGWGEHLKRNIESRT